MVVVLVIFKIRRTLRPSIRNRLTRRWLPIRWKGRAPVMSTAICAVWLLASVTGAEPAGVAYASESAIGVAPMVHPLAAAPRMLESSSITSPIVVYHDCRVPEPLLYIDTTCSTRWYTMINVEHHRQPYNYLVQFDYPWHSETGCASHWCVAAPPHPAHRPQATLAPLETTEGTRTGGGSMSRPSAIRRVD